MTTSIQAIKLDLEELLRRCQLNLVDEPVKFPVPLPLLDLSQFDDLENWVDEKTNKLALV